MDTFIILCFIAVFAALVEFACINFLDTFVKRRKKREDELAIEKEKLAEVTESPQKEESRNLVQHQTVVTASDLPINEDAGHGIQVST